MKKPFAKVENLNPTFRWRDVPRALWYFLREDRGKFIGASVVIFIIQFLDLLPAILGGKIVDFFTTYHDLIANDESILSKLSKTQTTL